MRSKIFKEILDEMNSDPWYIKLRRWLKIKLWLLKKFHFGSQMYDVDNGLLLIYEMPNEIKEYSSLLMAYRVFKSSGGTIEQAMKQLGTVHYSNSSTLTPANTLANHSQEICLDEPCMKMVGGIKVFCCATVCAGLKNCKIRV